MKSALSHGACVLLVVLAVAVSGVAHAAEPEFTKEEQDAVAELQALLNIQPRPKSQEELTAKLTELLPKLEAFAQKHEKNRVGAQALLFIAQIELQFIGDEKKATQALQEFVRLYPDSDQIPMVKFLLARAQYDAGNHKAAKEALAAHLKAYPDFKNKAAVEELLKEVELIGTLAKDFTTTDLAGKEVKLSDFRGKIVILDFFAGWCGPCRAELPNLKKLYADYRDRGLEIVGVSLDRTLDEAKEYVQQASITWPVTFQAPGFWKNPVAVAYGVRSIPAMYVLDKAGNILHMGLRGEQLAKVLAELLPLPEKK